MEILNCIVASAALSLSVLIWLKTNAKAKLLTDPKEAFEVVPTWFTPRMMQDHWHFALLLSNGKWALISCIKSVSSDGKWIEVELAERGATTLYGSIDEADIISSQTNDRPEATIRTSDIILATETADT
jgi:hypothetical protein